MSDIETADALTASLHRRAQRVDPRPNLEMLLGRLDRRVTRHRRVLAGGLVAVLAVGGVVGYAIGSSSVPETTAVVALNDGVPDPAANAPAIEPENVGAAVIAINQAFHDAFDAATPAAARLAATQNGAQLEALRREALASARRFGLSAEELAGVTIEVAEPSFVDRTHAVVRFTLTVPGRGPVLVDQVGYAVVDAGRWKVSLRTACDLLSLSGLGRPCPPTAT
jgi:hypothetical protein